MRSVKRKSEGFAGEKIIELPKQIIALCRRLPLIADVFIARMGFYPRALNHYFQRPKGSSQSILIYCTDGKGWIKMNNKHFLLQSGDYVIIKPGISHSYGSDKDIPWTIYWFHLYERTAGSLLNTLAHRDAKPVNKVQFTEERIMLFDKIYTAFTKGYSNDLLIFANLTFGYFFASLLLPQNFEYSNKLPPGNTVSQKAIQFMKANIKSLITLNDTANHCGLSVSFFSRKFKQETGYAPVEYLNYLKIQRACQLLHFSKLKINELIAQIGITDAFYFSRLFKKQMGISPIQYRKNEGVNWEVT
jgi:AraC family transcriptional regulator, arabinose operon regulatory protein